MNTASVRAATVLHNQCWSAAGAAVTLPNRCSVLLLGRYQIALEIGEIAAVLPFRPSWIYQIFSSATLSSRRRPKLRCTSRPMPAGTGWWRYTFAGCHRASLSFLPVFGTQMPTLFKMPNFVGSQLTAQPHSLKIN